MEKTILLKLAGILVYWLLSFFSGLAPVKIQTVRQSTKWSSVANCFAGGVFIALGLVHLLPEGTELIEEGCEFGCDYPYSYLISVLGYVLILAIEKIVFHAHATHGDAPPQDEQHVSVIHPDIPEPVSEAQEQEQVDEVKRNLSARARLVASIKTQNALSEPSKQQNELEQSKQLLDLGQTDEHVGAGAYILLIALCIHSVFEGIAIGLQSKMFKLLNTMGAIAAHKWAASLSIGISLSKTGLPDPPIYRLLALFSAATPFGILLGIAISKAANEAVQGVFFSITVGTFLYIAASEVIVEEFAITRYKYIKFGSFLVGIVTISLLTLYDPD